MGSLSIPRYTYMGFSSILRYMRVYCPYLGICGFSVNTKVYVDFLSGLTFMLVGLMSEFKYMWVGFLSVLRYMWMGFLSALRFMLVYCMY